ncbi:hypothetical protein HNO88_002973 [Novosphingobium chloroacetimidivorans]|uniref:Uncharacterized protein n=1 Tax=Novosphingobium chloroacetimidivorans TaxID=1428314 RepID=A0A7W7KCA8_9SPHN|nr:hypothetical protein [Novosphingobium chloroacetimidivorans]MBB4859644.1 hypothetical protein [Novosphingobium chloroacetimidivorans]
MAELIGTQWSTLRDWIDAAPELEGKGALIRGGNGVLWQIKPLRTIDMLIKRFEKSVEQQAARNRKVRQATGINLPDAEDAASFAETKQMVDMTLAIVAAREKQGEFAPRREVLTFLEGYNASVTAAILGVRTRADPNGNLPPHVRAQVDDYLRSVATQVHAQAAKYIEEQRARLQQERVG